MPQPPPGLLKTIRAIDSFSEFSGKAVALLIFPLFLGLTWEAISRYLLNSPTVWAYDLSYMLYSAFFMLGAHIRTDMLWEKFSDRTKGLIDAGAYVFFVFPGMILLFYASVDEAWASFVMWERSEQTAWRPIIWPFKGLVPLTAALILIQGVSELLKSLYAARTGVTLSKRESVEI
jgi:TRAP-type mannitol/chloroaromatic compound transport system permease small subunit